MTEPNGSKIYHIYPAAKILPLIENQIDDAKAMTKPSTALFQRREDDEPTAPQDVHEDMSSDNSSIAAGNSLISFDLKFEAVIFLARNIS